MHPHWLQLAARECPSTTAIEAHDGVLTYAELRARAWEAAVALGELGVSSGARVALALPPGVEFVVAVHGCWYAGAVPVPIDLRLTAEERAVRAAGAVTVERPLRTDRRTVSMIGLSLQGAAAIVHTSGTTSVPKPVELTFGNFLASAHGSRDALGLDPAERWLCPMPLAHVGGLSIPIRSAIYATTAVLHGRFDTEAVLGELMDPARRITLVSLVPTMLARLLDAGLQRPPALRWALLGGGPIPPALLERAREAGVPVAPTYGMTEACSQIATHGWPLPEVSLSLASDGEVLVRGAIVAPGAVAADGWLHTGDFGRFEADGRLKIIGRKADTIVSGGENVAPVEVEAALLSHPAVIDAAVFPRPDPEWGEAVVARVVLRDGLRVASDELRAHCSRRLAGFKVPKAIEFASALPRSESGKLLRRELGSRGPLP